MKVAEPKFKIGDEVKTNGLYGGMFPEREPYKGNVTKVYPSYTKKGMRVIEPVIMVSVDNRRAINQDYFDFMKV